MLESSKCFLPIFWPYEVEEVFKLHSSELKVNVKTLIQIVGWQI